MTPRRRPRALLNELALTTAVAGLAVAALTVVGAGAAAANGRYICPPEPDSDVLNCEDFDNNREYAQSCFLRWGGPENDSQSLDKDDDGFACEPLDGPTCIPRPAGDIYNCEDFEDQPSAQKCYVAWGGPALDSQRLDRDRDGMACDLHDSRLYLRPPGAARPSQSPTGSTGATD